MVSTYTPNLNLELQGTGDNVGLWGDKLNVNDFTVVDSAMGKTQILALPSSGTLVLTTSQTQVNTYILTGNLTGTVTIQWPDIGRTYTIVDKTTRTNLLGIYLKLTNPALAQAELPQGRTSTVTLHSQGVSVPTDTGVPIGMVAPFAVELAPTGWLACRGQAVSRSTYSMLFALIYTTFGPGDGATTFNLPDLRGYFVRGWNNSGSSGPDKGRAFGSAQSSANLSHTHTGTTSTSGVHDHSFSVGTAAGTTVMPAGAQRNVGSSPLTDPAGAHNHTFTTASSGTTEARPYNVAMLYAIRAY